MSQVVENQLARRFSFYVLVAAVLGAGVLFYRVVEPFLFPLFFAAVLALLFWPLHAWVEARLCFGYRRLSAAAMTIAIVLLVMVPLSGALFLSASELIDVGREAVEWLEPPLQCEVDRQLAELRRILSSRQFDAVRAAIRAERPLHDALQGAQGTRAGELLDALERGFSHDALSAALDRQSQSPLSRLLEHRFVRRLRGWIEPMLPEHDINQLRDVVLRGLEGVPRFLYTRTTELVGNTVYFLIGLAVLTVSLYYFFADGPEFLKRLQRLSPLEDRDEEILFARFQRVCQGVVLATIVSAFVQALLATAGYMLAGVARPVLLGLMTLLLAMIPFIGAAGIWGPVALYLLFQGRVAAAIFLAVYGTIVVSLSDNVVKVFVIHGQGRMHPLVVFVTMLGALRAIGLWGIFVGPLIAAVFYALVALLHRHLDPEDVEVS